MIFSKQIASHWSADPRPKSSVITQSLSTMIFDIDSLEGEPNGAVNWVEVTRRGRAHVRQFITTQSHTV